MREAFILTSIGLGTVSIHVSWISKILIKHAHRTVHIIYICWPRSTLVLGKIVDKISVWIRLRVWTGTVIISRWASKVMLVLWVWIRLSIISWGIIGRIIRHILNMVRIVIWDLLRYVLTRVVANWHVGIALNHALRRTIICGLMTKLSSRLLLKIIDLMHIHHLRRRKLISSSLIWS